MPTIRYNIEQNYHCHCAIPILKLKKKTYFQNKKIFSRHLRFTCVYASFINAGKKLVKSF